MLSFKGTRFSREVILHAAFFCLRYGVSYRDLEDILAESGLEEDGPAATYQDLSVEVSRQG